MRVFNSSKEEYQPLSSYVQEALAKIHRAVFRSTYEQDEHGNGGILTAARQRYLHVNIGNPHHENDVCGSARKSFIGYSRFGDRCIRTPKEFGTYYINNGRLEDWVAQAMADTLRERRTERRRKLEGFENELIAQIVHAIRHEVQLLHGEQCHLLSLATLDEADALPGKWPEELPERKESLAEGVADRSRNWLADLLTPAEEDAIIADRRAASILHSNGWPSPRFLKAILLEGVSSERRKKAA